MNQSQINLTAVDLQISRLNPEISRRSVSETYVNSMIYWKPRCSGCDEKSTIVVRFRNQKNKGSPKLRFGSPCVINTAKVSWKKNHHLYATKQIFSKRITDLTLQYFSSSGQWICRCRRVRHCGFICWSREPAGLSIARPRLGRGQAGSARPEPGEGVGDHRQAWVWFRPFSAVFMHTIKTKNK